MKQFKIFIMFYKSKLYIMILVLVISLGLIPIGALVRGFVREQVNLKVSDTLLGIQQEVIPVIEEEFIGLGIPETLEAIREQEVPEINNDVVLVESIPKTLNILRNKTIEKLPKIINCTITARIIYETLANVTANISSSTNAREYFFNYFNFSSNFSTQIKGISEFTFGGDNKSLSYSSTAQNRLLYGYTTGGVEYPGILTDLEAGMGIIEWLEFYDNAENNTGDTRSLIQTIYATTWESKHLQNFSRYIRSYIWPNITVKEYTPLNLETYANLVYYEQWANGTFNSEGFFLHYLVEELREELQAASAADKIDSLIKSIKPYTGGNLILAREYVFNDYNLKDNFSVSVAGISERASGGTYSLNFTTLAQERILYGYQDYPGLFTEITTGFGLLKWMDIYDSALTSIPTRNLMVDIYNATWETQIFYVGQYIRDYIFGEIVTTEGIIGLEIGIPNPSNIRYNTTLDLWDPLNINSIINITGIKKWYEASKGDLTIKNELNSTFNLNSEQFDLLIDWLFENLKKEIVPVFFTFLDFQGFRVLPIEYADVLFLRQWANGTVYTSAMDLGDGITGFEAGIPIPLNISLNITTALFDSKNESGFVNKEGLLKWMNAYYDDFSVQTELNTTFQLDNTQLEIITHWLFDIFKVNVVENLVEDITEYTKTELAISAFYWQWANGTLFPDGIDPGAAMGLDSLDGWELGIPTPTNILESSARKIWNAYSTLAIVNPKGIARWFKAIDASSTYKYLKDKLNLNNSQMDAILRWLPMIRDKFALPLLQYESGLPINQYELANIYFVAITVTGSILSGISALAVIWMIVSKQKNREYQ